MFIGQEDIWAITLKDTRQLIGSIGIVPDPKRENPQVRMLGYWLDEAHWGKGYMTEAVQAVLNYGFNELQLSLITANCYPHNKRSQQVLERNGFICEGVLHQAELTYNGNIYDHLCYYLPNICRPAPEDYDEILQVWEDSVRHTHHFLTEEHIQFYKPLVRNHYLSAVELYIIRNTNGKIVAFMGLSDELIEMLFVSPGEQGKGYGRRLLEYATRRKQMNKVDVNEQNDKALGFYLRMGFRIIGVSPDSEKSHRSFCDKHDLNFTLLSDTDHSVCEAYGVWAEKSMYGRKYMGVLRTTFVIDAEGRIEKIFTKVDTKNHYRQIIDSYK